MTVGASRQRCPRTAAPADSPGFVADLSRALARSNLGLPERRILLGAGLQRLGQKPCRRERTQHWIAIEESAEPSLPLPLIQVWQGCNEFLRVLPQSGVA